MSIRVKLEAVAKKAGYENISSLVCHWLIDKKMTFADITDHVQTNYGVTQTYSAVYIALRKFAPADYGINTRFCQSREDLAKSKGFSSFTTMLISFAKRKLNYREIAEELGQKSSINIKRLEKIYGIQLAANAEAKKAGFVNSARYRVWLAEAKKLGYTSVEDALMDMKKNKRSVRDIASAFKVSPQSLWRRLKRIEQNK